MDEILQYFFIESIPDTIVAVILSLIALRLTFGRHKAEFLWMKRKQTYNDIIYSMAEMRLALSFIASKYEYSIPDEKEFALNVGFYKVGAAYKKLDKFVVQANFLLSKEILPVINSLNVAFASSQVFTRIMEIHKMKGPPQEVHEILRPLYIMVCEKNDEIKKISLKHLGQRETYLNMLNPI